MKKFLAMALSLAMVLSLAACGSKTEAPAEEPAQPTPPAEETGGDGGETSYTVVSGDCLWNISYHFYGTGAKFTRIAEANGLKDPYLIHIGQVLVIPAA